TANQPHLHQGAFSVRGLSIQSGAIVTVDTASLTDLGAFANAGGFLDPHASGSITLAGAGSKLSGNLNVTAATLQGSYTLNGDVQASSFQVVGSLTLGGHALVATTSFSTGGTGVITMTNPADSLVV